MRTGSALWRLLVSTHVLLCVGISAHELLRARLVRPGRILPNRLFGIAAIPLSGRVLPRHILLNGLVVADVVTLDRIVRAMSALLRVLIALRIGLVSWRLLTGVILLCMLVMPRGIRLNLLVVPRCVLLCSIVATVLISVDCRSSMGPSRGRPRSTGAVCTTGVPRVFRRVRIQFVSTLQLAIVLDAFSFNGLFAFRCLGIQLLGLCRLTISLGSTSVSLSLCALCLCSLFLDFGLSRTNIMFGLGSLLPNLRGLLPLVFALLRCRLAADCDDDPDDDQDHDDGDDDPDDG
ncbi:hypothetical protein [Brevibacterium sp. 1718]|uniref:hypothetical protein n=1 Tax=Brevibacterium sp. 1718 TaxID=3413510 RepID=UPI003DA8CF9C